MKCAFSESTLPVCASNPHCLKNRDVWEQISGGSHREDHSIPRTVPEASEGTCNRPLSDVMGGVKVSSKWREYMETRMFLCFHVNF